MIDRCYLDTSCEEEHQGWVEGESFQLKAPILNFTIQEILNDEFRAKVIDVLKFWIGFDVENFFRIKSGIHHFQVPYAYETNSTRMTGLTEQGGPFDEESFLLAQKRLIELLRAIGFQHYRNDSFLSAAIYALILRHLSTDFKLGEFSAHNSFLHTKINNAFGVNRYAYEAIDSLLDKLKSELESRGIRDGPV